MLSNIFCPPPFLLRIDIVYSMQYSFSPPIHCFEINAEKKGFFPCFVIGSYTYLFIYLFYSYKAIFCIFDFFFLEQQCLVHLLFDPGARKKNKVFANCCQNEILSRAVFLLIPFYLFTHFIYIYIFSFSSTRSEFLIIPAYILTGSSLYKSVFLSRDC